MSIMALDYGDKTIGVAVTDSLGIAALGLCVITRDSPDSFKKPIAQLREIINNYDIKTIVLGYPKNMDGSESVRCKATQDFSLRLKRNFKRLDIVLWDERLSTKGAQRFLQHLSKAKQDSVIDESAAVFILQGYLQSLNQTILS